MKLTMIGAYMTEAHTSVVERTSRRRGPDPRKSRENARAPRSGLRKRRTLKGRMTRVEDFRTQGGSPWVEGVGEDGPKKTK